MAKPHKKTDVDSESNGPEEKKAGPAYINFEREQIENGCPWRVWHGDRVHYCSEVKFRNAETVVVKENKKGLIKVENPYENIDHFDVIKRIEKSADCTLSQFYWEDFKKDFLPAVIPQG